MRKKSYFAASSAAALISAALACPAYAQSANTPDASGQANVEKNDNIIVVTAQKREQNLQDVPLSITVVGGQELQKQGANSLVDYAGYVPGLAIDNAGTPGLSTVTLRGISPTTSAAAVGFYLDDAPVGSSSLYARGNELSLDLLPYDIERIEVLRGPQGTLYGASSIGGLLKYVTVEPNVSEFGIRAGAEAFSIDGADDLGWAGQVMVNAPLVTDLVAVTGSFAWRKSPGWVDNTMSAALDNQNEYEQMGGRVSVLVKATEDLSIELQGIWQSIDAESNGAYAADLTGERLGNGTSGNNFVAEPFNSRFAYYSGTLNYDLGPIALTSVSTYSDNHSVQIIDGSYIFGTLFPLLTGGAIDPGLTPTTYTVDLEKFSQEVRLASTGTGALSWLVGGFYTHEKSAQDQLVRSFDMAGVPIAPLDPLAIVALPATYKEYAVFGNMSLRLGERFEITGGVRWARNEQEFRQISSGAIVPLANDPGSSSESIFTYSLSPQFKISEDAMVYARVASGYRPGGPNVIVPGVPPTVDSDTLTNYEIGFKADLADRMVTVDVAAFYMDWKDIQVAQSFGGIGGLANGGTATSKGVEGALTIRPVSGLSLGLTAAYTDSTLSEDVPAISGLDGDRLPNVPKFSGSARLDYAVPVNGGDELIFGAGVRYTGKRLSLVESDPQAVRAREYTAVDLNASYTFNGHWTVRAYARNLLNDKGELSRSLIADGLDTPVYLTITPLQPRTVGLALELDF